MIVAAVRRLACSVTAQPLATGDAIQLTAMPPAGEALPAPAGDADAPPDAEFGDAPSQPDDDLI